MILAAKSAASSLTFYEVAAQIIPVLFLALVVEERLLESRGKKGEPATDFFILAAILLGVVAEMVSINALIEGKPAGDTERLAVIYAIVLLFVPFVVRAALPSFSALAKYSRWGSWLLQGLIILITVGAIATTFADIDLIGAASAFAVILLIISLLARNYEVERRTSKQRAKAEED